MPAFIWAPEEEGQFQPGRCYRWWVKQSLAKLQLQIAALGSRLIVRRSEDSTSSLQQLVQETGAQVRAGSTTVAMQLLLAVSLEYNDTISYLVGGSGTHAQDGIAESRCSGCATDGLVHALVISVMGTTHVDEQA